MKKIQYILFAIAFLALVPAKNVQAQTETTYKNGLGYSKNISTPDDEGIYTITLEAFTTGDVTVTKKSIPADIVLVLDVSGSMAYDMGREGGNSNQRLNALKTAVNNFIDIINENDLKDPDGKDREQRLGNRIAIVTYSTNANNRSNGLIPLGSSLTDNSGVTTLKGIVNGLTAGGGTYAHRGMNMAYGILSPLGDTHQLRTTVFFTDGNPGYYGDWTGTQYVNQGWGNVRYREDSFRTANATIYYANQIKNLANAEKGITSKVYSVSIITNPGVQAQVYLGKTSSNWLGANNMGWYDNNWNTLDNSWNYNHAVYLQAGTQNAIAGTVGSRNTDGKNYSFASTSAQGLNDIFETIASESGGSDADLGGSTVAVMDIVSANFMLPNGADPNQISVYTAPCTGGTVGALTFGTPIKAPGNTAKYHKIIKNPDGTIDWEDEELDVDNAISVSVKSDNKSIEVTGFDYASNFCGFENGVARGFKVLIEIPVKMDPEAVGGPNSDSNEPGSGIYADLDGDGILDPIIKYDPPKVDLPTNIHILKQGLKKGESAKFRIERIPKANPESTAWEPVTTVFLTKTSDTEEPLVKVRGLDPNYIYQVVEEPWSWAYTPEAITPTRTDQLITNPFKFNNTPKEGIDKKIRHAESKATNDFIGSGSATYVDSKNNGR